MQKAYASAANCANSRGAKTGLNRSVSGSVSQNIAERLKAIYPDKTWSFVWKLLWPTARDKERAAKHRVAATRDFTVDELATLLRSEHGFHFLADMMGDARPQWWALCAPLMQAAEARRLQHAAQKKIQRALRGALDADTDLSATIHRAEAAMAFQDEDFMRPHLDGLHAQRGLLDRPVASPAKGRGRR